MEWTGLIWLRIETSGWLLWTRQWTFGFHKMLGNSWVAVQTAASQEGLSSMELVTPGHYWQLRRDLNVYTGSKPHQKLEPGASARLSVMNFCTSAMLVSNFDLKPQGLRYKKNGKSITVPGRRDSHIFKKIGSQMAVRLSVLRAGRSLPPGRFLVLTSVRGWVDPRVTGWNV
jgi:hypothetical protein